MLSWLVLCPPAIAFGLATNGLLARGGHASPPGLAAVGAGSAAIAALVTAIAPGLGRVPPARRRRKPVDSWRVIVGVELSAAGGITLMVAHQLGVSRTLDLAADIAGLALAGLGIAFVVLGAIQVTRQATTRQQGTQPAA